MARNLYAAFNAVLWIHEVDLKKLKAFASLRRQLCDFVITDEEL